MKTAVQREPIEEVDLAVDDAKELAEAIRRVDQAVRELMASGLNRRAWVVLLSDSTGVKRTDIMKVLKGLESLKAKYLE